MIKIEEREAFWNELNGALNGTGISAKSSEPGWAYIKYESIRSSFEVQGNLSSRGEHAYESKIWVMFHDNDRNVRNQKARDLLLDLRNAGFNAEIDPNEAKRFAKVIIYDTNSTPNTDYQHDAGTTAELLKNIEKYLQRI